MFGAAHVGRPAVAAALLHASNLPWHSQSNPSIEHTPPFHPSNPARLPALQLLLDLATAADVPGKVAAMFEGQHLNATEGRAVLHVALRAPRGAVICDQQGGGDVVPEVWEVLDKIKAFTGGYAVGICSSLGLSRGVILSMPADHCRPSACPGAPCVPTHRPGALRQVAGRDRQAADQRRLHRHRRLRAGAPLCAHCAVD